MVVYHITPHQTFEKPTNFKVDTCRLGIVISYH